jgi:2-methylcitrate dehydratase PrpD
MFGQAAEDEYLDAIVQRADVIALRDKVSAVVDNSIDEASVDVTITMNNGTVHHLFVEHAIGSIHKPLTDAMLEAKFHGLVDPVLGKERADALIAACWGLGAAADVRALTKLAQP